MGPNKGAQERERTAARAAAKAKRALLEYCPSRWVTESICCRANAAFSERSPNANLIRRWFDGWDRLYTGSKYTAKWRRDYLSLVR
jgi:hypothetical protein